MKLKLKSGLKFEKVCRIMEFKQKALLKQYIKCNKELPKEAEKSNKIRKQNAKLRNNAVFVN